MMRKALRTGPRAAAREKTMSRSEPSRPKMRTTRKARSDRSTCRYAARKAHIILGQTLVRKARSDRSTCRCASAFGQGASALRCETPLQGRLERKVYSLAVPQPSITQMTDSDTLGRRAQVSLAAPHGVVRARRRRRHTTRHAHRTPAALRGAAAAAGRLELVRAIALDMGSHKHRVKHRPAWLRHTTRYGDAADSLRGTQLGKAMRARAARGRRAWEGGGGG